MKPFNHNPEAVTKARDDAGFSKTELARGLGVSQSLISEIEGGTRNAREDLLERMAEFLSCDVADLRAEQVPA